VRPNAPELRKVHAGLEAAYLAAIARKDKTSQALARKIKGPWIRVEKLLKRRPAKAKANPRRRRRNPAVRLPRGLRKRNPKRSSSRGQELVAFTVKRGGRAVGKVLATTALAAAKEAKAAGLQLGRELKGEFCRTNPPRGAVLSERAESVTYQHEQDGEWYKHKFAPGVVIKVSPNKKRVTLYRPDGKPVAGNFWVP
jgi:hypothetical protein